ncbi:MAG TPA: nuclear transport factor 2 family protein [Actinomycetota bacterium]|nr:nuclear transport factor 2 family protein [Actinomycetota bacterium]
MPHPNEDLLRSLYERLHRGDVTGFLSGCADDVVFSVPGHAAVSGTFTKATFAGMARAAAVAEPGSFREDIVDVIANDEHGIVLLNHRLRRAGVAFAYRTAHVMTFSGGLISSWWEHPGSVAELEAAWGPAPREP